MSFPLPKLAYSSPAEKVEFHQEISQLDPTRYLVGDRPGHLLVIYRRLVAEMTPFAHLLRESTPASKRIPLIKNHLDTWIDRKTAEEPLFDVLLYLDARTLDADTLRLLTNLPPFLCAPNELGTLRAAPLRALNQLARFMDQFFPANDQVACGLAYVFLLETFFHEAGELCSNEELQDFLEEAYPALLDKFPDCRQPGHEEHLADWFKLWLHHRRREVPNIPQEHSYYNVSFDNIVKYLPPVILWNNGVPYFNGAKEFQYYSETFFWLATGGSLRKLPDHPPYSRRMAKEFLALPNELGNREADTYVHCFFLSLGASTEMALALQRFFRRPAEPAALTGWKETMDPIVQKLQAARFDWSAGEGDHLLGYLHHAVRDQFGFAVNAISIEQLEREAAAYYARIDARQEEAQRRQAERNAARAQERDPDRWPPLSGVAGWVETLNKYGPLRKWKIVELTNRNQLAEEGRDMRHCVGTYAEACLRRHSSIWSIRELRLSGEWHSVATIEVRVKSRSIVQFYGRHNATPAQELRQRLENWAEREGLEIGQ
ncbi:PcfJ domain-containing protein [Neolewinella persica]|uniref:PcfJ domain-containing protein n=1 Tax=Neolewinella persica TaxID=70998 RepID=UPI0003829095|nr:PcfJ domain-containing protein [Neolewinella persica]